MIQYPRSTPKEKKKEWTETDIVSERRHINEEENQMQMKQLVIEVVVLAALSFTTGCLTNYYEQYYVSSNGNADYDSKTEKEKILLKTVTTENDVLSLLEDGYEPIGYASFTAPYTPLSLVVDTAYKHGADLVLTDIRFKEEKQRTSIMYLPSYSTSYHNGSVGGYAYSGKSTTTTMNAVPIVENVSIYMHDAMFFRRINQSNSYGILWHVPKRLPTEKIDDPIVVHVLAVLHGSKAERDGIKRGQIVNRINGRDIKTRQDIAPFLNNEASIVSVEVKDEK